MIISVAALVAALIPLCLGGRLSRLGAIPFRHTSWIVAALAIQILIIEVLPGPALLLQTAHIATYVVAGWFILANRRIPGLWLIGLGAGLNGLAITVNGGTLPARLGALGTAGINLAPEEFVNSGLLPHPRLAFLGDIFAIPAGFPLANVFSIGDVLIVLGTGCTAWAILGTRWAQPWTPTPRRAPRHALPRRPTYLALLRGNSRRFHPSRRAVPVAERPHPARSHRRSVSPVRHPQEQAVRFGQELTWSRRLAGDPEAR